MQLLRIGAWQRCRRRSRNSPRTAFTEAVGWRGGWSRPLEVTAEPATSTTTLLERLLAAGRELARGRSARGAITHAVGRLVALAQAASHLEPDELQFLVADEANALIASRDRAAASIAIASPPFEEGRRLAEELSSEGLDVELVEERDVDRRSRRPLPRARRSGHRLRGRLDRNKIGTLPLAEVARRLGIRTLVACELLKLAPIPSPRVEDEPKLRDTTPSELVDEIVTEEGATAPKDVKSLIARTPFLRDGYRLLR